MTSTRLTPAQRAILTQAIEHDGGEIVWFPENIKGGARKQVLEGLAKRALIVAEGTGWRVAAEDYAAMGHDYPIPAPLTEDAEIETAVAMAEARWAGEKPAPRATPYGREHSKQAEVIRMLQRPQGATVRQIVAATGWQAHTVRGAFAGTFKKKLGLTITSEKPEGGERIYRIG